MNPDPRTLNHSAMPARSPLADDQIDAALDGLAGWRRQPAAPDAQPPVPQRIVWERTFDDFQTAFAFLTRVAFLAESMDHHPEITNVYGDVRLALSTHDADDRVTDTDLELARRISAV